MTDPRTKLVIWRADGSYFMRTAEGVVIFDSRWPE
jgi:hypothetical protein